MLCIFEALDNLPRNRIPAQSQPPENWDGVREPTPGAPFVWMVVVCVAIVVPTLIALT